MEVQEINYPFEAGEKAYLANCFSRVGCVYGDWATILGENIPCPAVGMQQFAVEMLQQRKIIVVVHDFPLTIDCHKHRYIRNLCVTLFCGLVALEL